MQFLVRKCNTAYDSHMTNGLCWRRYLSLPAPARGAPTPQESESIEF